MYIARIQTLGCERNVRTVECEPCTKVDDGMWLAFVSYNAETRFRALLRKLSHSPPMNAMSFPEINLGVKPLDISYSAAA